MLERKILRRIKKVGGRCMNGPEAVATEIRNSQARVRDRMNAFCEDMFVCRGGRIGSGFGTVLEGLWGFFVNQALDDLPEPTVAAEIAWLGTNQYNDFAVVEKGQPWDTATGIGELFRIEAKSMNLGAVEAKGHFDEIQSRMGADDQLVVLMWGWHAIDGLRVVPRVNDSFVGSARKVAALRDVLHIGRGGSFVSAADCPDGCNPTECPHDGEPLNARGFRERRFGPESRRGTHTANAANFGGLVRMLRARTDAARIAGEEEQARNTVARDYVLFVERNLANAAPSIPEEDLAVLEDIETELNAS